MRWSLSRKRSSRGYATSSTITGSCNSSIIAGNGTQLRRHVRLPVLIRSWSCARRGCGTKIGIDAKCGSWAKVGPVVSRRHIGRTGRIWRCATRACWRRSLVIERQPRGIWHIEDLSLPSLGKCGHRRLRRRLSSFIQRTSLLSDFGESHVLMVFSRQRL